jgi:sigma-B regulation protein RsbU (phosphoserine phosphatase)
LQLDSTRPGKPFHIEDLQLVTAVALQAAVVLDNAALHAELLREERLRRELALAQEIQKSFLPTNFPDPGETGYDLFARILPAREVSGDLYDFFALKDNSLAFFVGDVAGKGVPAALFIIAVRTLSRYLASSGSNPAETLERLNHALAVDNFSGIFVTLLHGIYRPHNGELIVASGGHPAPLLRRADGTVVEVPVPNGRFLGYAEGALHLRNHQLIVAPGETFMVYTDGFSEAHPPGNLEMFGAAGLKKVLAALEAGEPLEALADRARASVQGFTGPVDQQDDQTLLLLRRIP